MVNRYSGGASLNVSSLLALGLLAAGCQAGDTLGAFDMRGDRSQAEQETVNVEDLRAFCPQVTLREGTAFFNTYERNAEGDPARMIYQASIADVTRSCNYNGSTVTMNVAVAGRVVPGPSGTTGTVTMPIRIAAVRGSEVLYSQLHQHAMAIADTAGATQFIFNDPNVTFVLPADQGVRVFVGYDEGP